MSHAIGGYTAMCRTRTIKPKTSVGGVDTRPTCLFPHGVVTSDTDGAFYRAIARTRSVLTDIIGAGVNTFVR